MRVLGVDPGLARTGVAIVEADGPVFTLHHAACVETSPGPTDPERLVALYDALDDLVRRWQPDVAAVERLYFATNRTSAMRVSEARGVALCALARRGVTVTEYTPMQVKMAVAGYGGADKAQVARMVATVLRTPDLDVLDDVTDACAIAVCHHQRHGLGESRRVASATGGTAGLQRAIAAAQRAQARP